MSDNVINLADDRPHQSTYVACLVCGRGWLAVAPADTVYFECQVCRVLCGVEVKPDSVEFLNSFFFRGVKGKKELTKRMLVVLNAKRMIEGQQL